MKRKIKAFTLVELLVVIGIIALLISILLPALGRVRWQANMTACGARMHDLMNAMQMYANDNKGAIPPWPGDDGSSTFNANSFATAINGQWQFSSTSATGTMTLANAGTEKDDGAQLGRLWKTRYLKTAKVFYCPSAKIDTVVSDKPYRRDFAYYTYNPSFKYADAGATIVQKWWKKIYRYGIPSGNVLYKNGYSGADMTTAPPVWTRPMLIDSIYEFAGTGDKGNVAHVAGNRRGYNLAYADGHVKNFTENNYASRPGTNFIRFVNFANALGAAADGADINFRTSAWSDNNNSPYYAIPVNPR